LLLRCLLQSKISKNKITWFLHEILIAKKIIKYHSFKKIKYTLILFLSIIFLIQLYGQSENSEFKNLNVDDGLSQSTVNCIFQDKDGFLWFGTDDGLDKYDGYSFTVYNNDPADENSLSNNSVNTICTLDSLGNILLIGTINGLNEFDIYQRKFTRHIQNLNHNIKSRIDEIYCIYRDHEQNILIGTSQGLRLFNKQNGKFHFPKNEMPGVDLIEDNIIYSIFEDSFGNLWIGANNGLLKISKNRKHYDFYKNNLINQRGIVRFIFEDSRHRLWFCKSGDGIYKSNRLDTIKFEPLQNEVPEGQNIDDSDIFTILESNDGSIWLGGKESGLFHLNYSGNKLLKISSCNLIAKNREGLDSKTIRNIFMDNSGIIWIGTKAGIFQNVMENKLDFKLYRSKKNNINSLLDNSVWSFFESAFDNKSLWIGTASGLSKLNRQTGKFTNYPEPDNVYKNVSFQVRDICENDPKNLWLATLGGGIIKFSKENAEYDHLEEKFAKSDYTKSDLAYSVCTVGKDNIWYGTNAGGLIVYNKKTKLYNSIKLIPIKENEQRLWITVIYKAEPDILWLGTWKRGLIKYNIKANTYQQYMHNPDNPNSINSDIIFSIYKSNDSTLWVGTYGSGLNKFDLKTSKFSFYAEKDGLPNNVIYGILEDDSGNLWVSTNKGISKFNPETETFTNYDVNDGLQGNEFNLGAYYKTEDGELFFGGDNGFNAFYPNVSVNKVPPRIVLTSFTKNGTEINYKESLNNIKQVDLSYDENNFSIEFVALHYKDPLKNQYAYQLTGIDKHWVYTNNQRKVSYTGLLPGDYVFKIKAANCDGVWTENPFELSIIISPPYWKKLWFILAVSILILTAVFIYGRNKAYRKLTLEKIKGEERESLRKKIAADFHDELGSRVTKISMMSKLLEKELSNKREDASGYIDMITENADGLFDEMREFIWELNPEQDSLSDLAYQLKSFSEQLFDKTEIAFQLTGLKEDYQEIKLPMDWRQHLLRIFKEGMHNVLKHAAECKNVCLDITFNNNYLIITLTNDGKGFIPETGNRGNGLKNMRERAEKINGQLNIKSANGNGTKITFSGKLP